MIDWFLKHVNPSRVFFFMSRGYWITFIANLHLDFYEVSSKEFLVYSYVVILSISIKYINKIVEL